MSIVRSCKVENNINNRSITLLVAILASFLTPFMVSAVNIAIPSIGCEFDTNVILLSWIPTGYLLTAAIFAVPFGRIADIYGQKKIFLSGIIIFTVASFLCGISPSILSLIFFRILQGMGSAMIFVTSLAIITSIYPKKGRGKAIGLNVASVYIGLSIGPFLGGLITQYFGWRSIFLVIIPFGVFAILLTLTKIRVDWVECKGEKFDIIGSIIYSLALLILMYGFSILPTLKGIILIILGILGIMGFILYELRTDSPVFEVRLFKDITFGLSNITALINYSSTFAVIFLLSLYLQYIKGFDPWITGTIMVAQPIVMIFTGPIAGMLSDKYSPRSIATIGMIITTLSIFCFTNLNVSTSIAFVVLVLIIRGIGLGLFSSPNTSAIMGSVEKRYYGIASATVGTMRMIGQMLSMGIVIMVFSITVGNVQITSNNSFIFLTSINTIFILCTGLCFIGIFTSFARS